MTCKGVCVQLRAKALLLVGRYEAGQKRCQHCDIFIIYDGVWCPCCGCRLRTKSRGVASNKKKRI